MLSIWRICTRNDKKITWTFLVLKASRFDHFSYPPCWPSCVIFFLSVSQIDYPVSRTDYTTDDSSRIDSNRVDSTTFSTLPVRLLVWFFLSVSQIDFPVSRIDYTTDDSSRIETSRHYLRRIESVWVYWTTLTELWITTMYYKLWSAVWIIGLATGNHVIYMFVIYST